MRRFSLLIALLCACSYARSEMTLLGVDGVSATVSNSLTVNQWVDSGACATGSTCTITATIPAGDLLVFNTYTTGISHPTTVSNCGTYVDLGLSLGDGNSHYSHWGYIASSLSASSCIVNFSATTGGSRSYLWDLLQTGTPALDSINNYFEYAASNPTAQPPLTLSGTKCLAMAGAQAFSDVTAVSANWTDTHHQDNTLVADQVNVTSVTTPSWTIGANPITAGDVAFCFGPTTSANWALFDSSGGVNTQAPTATTLATATHGLAGGGPAAQTARNAWYWVVQGAGFTYDTGSHHALLNAAPRFLVSGAQYADTGGVGLIYDTSVNDSFLELFFPGKDTGAEQIIGVDTQTFCTDFWTDIPSNHTIWAVTDLFTVHEHTTGETVNVQLDGTGSTLRLQVEGSTAGSPVSIGSSTWVKICIDWNTGSGGTTHHAKFYDDTGAQIGNTIDKTSSGGLHPDALLFGENGGGHPPTGQHYSFDKISICGTGAGITACTDHLP